MKYAYYDEMHWKLVPKVATKEMMSSWYWGYPGDGATGYRAMLAAKEPKP